MDFSELSSEKMYSGELEGYTSFREASRRSLARVFGNMEKLSYIIVSGSRGDLSNDTNKAPTYYDKNGDSVYSFSGKLDINNGLAEYFTQLMKDVGKNNIGKFTFKEAYVTYEPRSIQSRHIRYLEGELVNSY